MRVALLAVLFLLLLSRVPTAAQEADSLRYLSLEDVRWELTEGSNFRVTGVVVSSAPRPMRQVQLSINGFDEAGFPLCTLGLTVPYVPGEGSTPFQFEGGAANKVHRVETTIVGGKLDPQT